MRASIQDERALNKVSPSALSAYARAAGWAKDEPYGDHSDVYVSGEAPEIIIPRTQRLGDYADVVSRLIEIFAETAETDALSLYRDLIIADRDVVRVRAAPEGADGAVTLDDGVNLITGARDMVLAAACSLREPRPFFRPRANREAIDYMRRVHLGQTERGSYVVTLLTPVVPLPMRQASLLDSETDGPRVDRRVTQRLIEAVTAAQKAAERTSSGDADAFFEAVEHGASANLCEAVATLIKPFGGIDVSLTWALTYPMRVPRKTVRFGAADAPILREAARSLRERKPKRMPERKPDMRLKGRIQRLTRDDLETDGTITLGTNVEGRAVSIEAALNRSDYDHAIQAHKSNAVVVITGDLEPFEGQWRLRGAQFEGVGSNKVDEDGDLRAWNS